MSDNVKDKYMFVSQKDAKWASIMITEGKFKDVIYNYGKVSIPEEKENVDGTLPFRFEYDIIDNVGMPREEFGEDFFNLIGDILVEIIDEQIKENNLEYFAND
ncbi:MAG: hypothetical protein QGH83_09490 [Candidatus Pacebacteria bacterium]|jgi:hypothetical protein|nr:hypothetical protein [Candidatus Paceibacterota bacterium]